MSEVPFESKRRSVAKAVSWRVIATLITAGVVYVLTGEIGHAAKVGLLDTVFKFGIYFLHERAWTRISFGRHSYRDYQI